MALTAQLRFRYQGAELLMKRDTPDQEHEDRCLFIGSVKRGKPT